MSNAGAEKSGAGAAPEPSARCGAGLWAKIRWSDVGEECVKGGRYRFISPVWAQRDCQDLGNGRLRPVRLLNAAVTNDPNLKGMVPLSNRTGDRRLETGDQRSEDGGQNGEATSNAQHSTLNVQRGEDAMANAGGGDPDQLYRWELGASPGDRHCPSCGGRLGTGLKIIVYRAWPFFIFGTVPDFPIENVDKEFGAFVQAQG